MNTKLKIHQKIALPALLTSLILVCGALAASDGTLPKPGEPETQIRLSLDVKDMDVHDFARLIAERYKVRIVVGSLVGGRISGRLHDAPINEGLKAMVRTIGCTLTKEEGAYYIGKRKMMTIDVIDLDVRDFILMLRTDYGVDVATDQNLNGKITVKISNVSIEDAIRPIFEGNGFAVTQDGGVYHISNSPKSSAQ